MNVIAALITNIYATVQLTAGPVNTKTLLADRRTLGTPKPEIAAHKCRQYIATVVTTNQLLAET